MNKEICERWAFCHEFRDILYEKRGTSDFFWASRPWTPTLAHDQPVHLDGDEIKSIVLHSPYIRHIIHKLHVQNNVPIEKMYRNAKWILDEIGFYKHMTVIRWFGIFISKLLKKLYSAVYVNEAKFLKIKSQMGRNPVLFVPSHKSYCDFVLMAYICFHYEVDIPRIAAGMDFLSMAVIGNLLRKSCAFFIRRSFNNDELYSSIFSQYVQTLIKDGDGPVEFFIEGTRSRTAKTLFPKFGFLSMALKPFFFGLVPDISVLPVTLNYDKILEEVLFGYELLGVPKPRESTKGFIKALSFLQENHGNVYVKFGNAISVKDYFNDKIDRSIHGSGPVHLQELSSHENSQIMNLAHTIVTKQRELIVLTCFNIMALILNNNIITSFEPLSISELTEEVKWLFSVFKILVPEPSGLAISDVTNDDIIHHLDLHKPLVLLSSDNKIQLGKLFSGYTEIDKSRLKGHALTMETLDVALPIIILQNYVNPCAYSFVPISFIALIVHVIPKNSFLSLVELFEDFIFLCSVFSYEFVFHDVHKQEVFDKALKQSESLNLVVRENNHIKRGGNEKLHFCCVNFLRPFIPGYRIVAETLLKLSRETPVEHELMKSCQKNVESEFLSQMNIHPNNLSLDVLKNAIQSYVFMKAVTKLKGSAVKFYGNETELKKIHWKLSLFDSSTKFCRNNFCQQFSTFKHSNM